MKNIIQHEFIGLSATIIASPCKTLVNRTGCVVDETMNTFKLEYIIDGEEKIITVPKYKTKFKFALPVTRAMGANSKLPITFELDGSILTKRPEDRIKKLAKLANKMNKRYNELKVKSR